MVLNITNSAGVLVQTLNLGRAAGGTREFHLERADRRAAAQAPAGTYTLSAQVTASRAEPRSPPWSSGTVDSVTMGSGASGLTLNIAGLGSVPFSSVQQISN